LFVTTFEIEFECCVPARNAENLDKSNIKNKISEIRKNSVNEQQKNWPHHYFVQRCMAYTTRSQPRFTAAADKNLF